MYTLAISCLTTSNLPWFMDLTFWVHMQYCSVQHWTLLPSPVTSTNGCCFCFGLASSFLLELFLCSSPVACGTPIDRGGARGAVHLSVSYLFAFHTVHVVLKARMLKWLDAITSRTAFLIFFWHCSLSVLLNTADFFMLIYIFLLCWIS